MERGVSRDGASKPNRSTMLAGSRTDVAAMNAP
ncbi:MAG: hypothetical protein QOG01_2891, partial [Pseudonocardiales bacterium]|nr:hypothetical protein [Pseudonocardiales bacterium]